MSRNSKTKPETQEKIHMQVITENSAEERTVTAADSNNTNLLLEKRKEEADKPIYLKRV
jgi:hypothetical protein